MKYCDRVLPNNNNNKLIVSTLGGNANARQVSATGTLDPNAPNPSYGRGQICWDAPVSCADGAVDFYNQIITDTVSRERGALD